MPLLGISEDLVVHTTPVAAWSHGTLPLPRRTVPGQAPRHLPYR